MLKTLSLAALIASEIGAPAPAPHEAPRAPVARETELVRVVMTSPRAGTVTGSLAMEGGALLKCDAQGETPGWRSGWVTLTVFSSVDIPGGLTAEVPLRGSVFVSGVCQKDRGGWLTGSGTVYGDGFVYKNGSRAGFISVEGTASIHEHESSDDVWLRSFVPLVGEYKLD